MRIKSIENKFMYIHRVPDTRMLKEWITHAACYQKIVQIENVFDYG